MKIKETLERAKAEKIALMRSALPGLEKIKSAKVLD